MEVSGQPLAAVALSPRKRAPGINETAGWVGPRADLVAVGTKENPFPYQKSSDCSDIQPLA